LQRRKSRQPHRFQQGDNEDEGWKHDGKEKKYRCRGNHAPEGDILHIERKVHNLIG